MIGTILFWREGRKAVICSTGNNWMHTVVEADDERFFPL